MVANFAILQLGLVCKVRDVRISMQFIHFHTLRKNDYKPFTHIYVFMHLINEDPEANHNCYSNMLHNEGVCGCVLFLKLSKQMQLKPLFTLKIHLLHFQRPLLRV